jgi:hypothetical protein
MLVRKRTSETAAKIAKARAALSPDHHQCRRHHRQQDLCLRHIEVAVDEGHIFAGAERQNAGEEHRQGQSNGDMHRCDDLSVPDLLISEQVEKKKALTLGRGDSRIRRSRPAARIRRWAGAEITGENGHDDNCRKNAERDK